MGDDHVFRTILLSVLGLVLAAGGPWAYERAAAYWKSNPSAAKAAAAAAQAAAAAPTATASKAVGTARVTPTLDEPRVPLITRGLPTDAAPNYDLAAVLRFDINPGEVLSRWPRVSTGMGQLQLMGYRVLLVSGIAEYDLAGSLTYYFDARQQCQRIAFYGTTGNPQRLITLLGQRFGFTRRVVNDPGAVHLRGSQRVGRFAQRAANAVGRRDQAGRAVPPLQAEPGGRASGLSVTAESRFSVSFGPEHDAENA